MALKEGLAFLNCGNSFTFRRGITGSIVDITMVSDDLLGRTQEWRVEEDMTLSDHQYITFTVRDSSETLGGKLRKSVTHSWAVNKLRVEDLRAYVKEVKARRLAEEVADDGSWGPTQLIDYLKKACDKCMPRKKPGGGEEAAGLLVVRGGSREEKALSQGEEDSPAYKTEGGKGRAA
ncbi:uncharacterized protein [Chelonus insularis]|uniref:uncharacterized protein n=1 Tax=Chelonus insularis TaxID=460826 RepID=UPI00158A65FB|nr:uncharacterized protein LOC118071067 [Chelonus insularis]